ncbi:MAG: hypothetical protein JWQ55_4738, partial [Rhodopila sp.]|nr:hypothetical protein [Rhodopila sp.]
MSDDDGAKDQRTDQLTDPRTEPSDDRLIAEEVRQEFVAVTETEGDVT